MSKRGLPEFLGIGERIKAMRMAKNISQRAFAEVLGIPVPTYSNYENGNRTPDLLTLCSIADALETDVADLIDVERAASHALKTLDDEIEYAETPEAKEYLDEIIESYKTLNLDGRKTAAERVEELTHIEKYKSTDKKE